MKKVLVAVFLCAASSFAAWDKFPVLGDGNGEVQAGIYSFRQGYDPKNPNEGSGIYLGIRYSPLQNLELMAKQDYGDIYTLGARYQVIPVLALGVDVGFPILSTAWNFTPNLQFSMDFVPDLLSLGSNVGVSIYTQDKEKFARGLDLDAGIELDLTIGKSLIWVGFDVAAGISRSKDDGKEVALKDEVLLKDEGTRGLELKPSIGYVAMVSDNLSLGTWVELGFGDKDIGYGDQFNTTVGVDFSVKF
jgi:hypothetical protein